MLNLSSEHVLVDLVEITWQEGHNTKKERISRQFMCCDLKTKGVGISKDVSLQ